MQKEKMEKKLNNMSHAFYTLVDLLSDNMPDCGDDEYVSECWDRYESALEEFKKAEKEAKNLI